MIEAGCNTQIEHNFLKKTNTTRKRFDMLMLSINPFSILLVYCLKKEILNRNKPTSI